MEYNDAQYNFEKEVILPNVSVGVCLNVSNCKTTDIVELGNGYCMKCWDRGLDKRGRRRQIIDRATFPDLTRV